MLSTTRRCWDRHLTRNILRSNQTINGVPHLVLPSRRSLIQTAPALSQPSLRPSIPNSVIFRHLSTSQRLNQSETKASSSQQAQERQEQTKRDDADSKSQEIPPEWWINALEATANAPWLFHLPNEPVDRLKRAFTLIFQVILYLGRPQDEEAAVQFLNAFSSAVVPPESEIGRARRAVANITRAVVHDISSIPLTSPLRGEQILLFEVFDALQPLHDVYLENMREGDVDAGEWSEFWKRAEPVMLTLGEMLDQKGFGLEPDERKTAEEAKEKIGEKDK